MRGTEHDPEKWESDFGQDHARGKDPVKRFAELLDRLVLTPARNGKLKLLVDYFRAVEDPDRGYAVAAITGDLTIAVVKPAMLRALVEERLDPVLLGYS